MTATVTHRPISPVREIAGGRTPSHLESVDAAKMLADAAERNDISVRAYAPNRPHAKLNENVRFIVERIIENDRLANLQVTQLTNLYPRELHRLPSTRRRRVGNRFQNNSNSTDGKETRERHRKLQKVSTGGRLVSLNCLSQGRLAFIFLGPLPYRYSDHHPNYEQPDSNGCGEDR